MPAIEPLHSLINISTRQLSEKEKMLLEAELLVKVYREIKELLKQAHKNYFQLTWVTPQNEEKIMEENFICFIVRDILSSEEYTLEGIAHYTDTHQDIIQEILIGRNTNPSAKLLRRVIELHRFVRRDLYETIMKKIINIPSTPQKPSCHKNFIKK